LARSRAGKLGENSTGSRPEVRTAPPDPGTVVDVREKQFNIKYDDGQRYWLTTEQIRALELKLNDAVECRWKGRKLYYPAHFLDTNIDNIIVEYDCDSSPNGPSLADKELTKIEFLRFHK
jgi:hypothetical protein